MGLSKLLDDGAERCYIYKQIEVINNRGERAVDTVKVPTLIRVTSSMDRSSIAELPGNIDSKVVKLLTRKAELGSWAKAWYQGEVYDIALPPRYTPGASKATRHVEFSLRSRNEYADEPEVYYNGKGELVSQTQGQR